MTAQLILVGGLPGSGKTIVGKELAKAFGVYLDKDTVAENFSAALLVALGSNANDRESQIYLDQVRPLEYSTMMRLACENLDQGRSVVCSAPFVREFNDPSWVDNMRFEAEYHDAILRRVWVHADLSTMRIRIATRGSHRDTWKLANWDTYTQELPKEPPMHTNSINADLEVLDNGLDSEVYLKQNIAQLKRKWAMSADLPTRFPSP